MRVVKWFRNNGSSFAESEEAMSSGFSAPAFLSGHSGRFMLDNRRHCFRSMCAV